MRGAAKPSAASSIGWCGRGADDPLIALFERTAAEAQEAGLTEAEVEAELAAYNAERRG